MYEKFAITYWCLSLFVVYIITNTKTNKINLSCLAVKKQRIGKNGVPCIRLARGKFELTNQDSAGGKKSSVLTSSKQVGKGFEIRQLFSLEMALNIYEKGFTLQKPYQFAKSEKYEPFCVSNLLFWHQKWVAGARHANSLIVRRVSPGRTIVVLF